MKGVARGLVWLALMFSSVPGASAAPDPLKTVHRLASRHERSLAKEIDKLPAPERFIADEQAAIAALVHAFDGDHELVRVESRRIETDWQYETRTGTHPANGEWVEQTRRRAVVSLSNGPIVSAAVKVIAESRTLVAGQGETSWVPYDDEDAQETVTATVMHVLRQVEDATLARAKVDLDLPALRPHIQAALPAGFTLDELQDGQGFVVRHKLIERVDAKRKQPPTAWERELRVEIRLPEPTPPHSLRFSSSAWNRYAVEDSWTDWELSELVDPRPARELRLALVKSVGAHLAFGEAVPVPEVNKPLTPPPQAPKLRTIAQLQAENLEEARGEGLATGRGWFRVSLTRAVISPSKPDGSTWDMSLKGVAGGVAAAAVVQYTGVPTLAEHAHTLAEYAAAQYPTSPDVRATFAIGNVRRDPATVYDTVLPTWGAAIIDYPFTGANDPVLFIRLQDEDAMSPDPIGECSFALRQILSSDTGEFRCGEATIELKAEWLRTL